MLCLCLASHYAFKPTRYLQDKHYKLLCRILLKIQFVSKMSSTAALLHLYWVRDYWLLLDTCNTHNKSLIWCNISQDSFNTFFASTQRRPLHGLRWVFLYQKKPTLSSFHDQFRTANPVPSAVCSSSSVGSKGIYTSCKQTTYTSFQEVNTAENHSGFKNQMASPGSPST